MTFILAGKLAHLAALLLLLLQLLELAEQLKLLEPLVMVPLLHDHYNDHRYLSVKGRCMRRYQMNVIMKGGLCQSCCTLF